MERSRKTDSDTDKCTRGAMTTVEAAHLLFSPHTMALLRDCGARESVVELVHSATEIEDVESLVPDSLASSLRDLVEEALACVESAGDYDFEVGRWLTALTE